MDPDIKYAVIVAGGSGTRMKSATPKQFIPVIGQPLLMHTITAFVRAFPSIHILLVLPSGQITSWEALTNQYRFSIDHQIVEGGSDRFYSVRNGLEHVPGECLVAIHDGVRPVITPEFIFDLFRKAREYGSAIPCIPVNESVRLVADNGNSSFARESLRIVQTPQVFYAEAIKKAYQQPFQETFTDDATVWEASGHPVHLTEGDPRNIKITYPEDLVLAEALLRQIGSGHSTADSDF